MAKKILIIISLTLLFIVAIFSYYLRAFKGIGHELSGIIICLSAAISVMAGFYAMKIYGFKSHNGRSLFFISIGLLFWFVGEILWTYYQLVLKIEFPFPATPDFFYTLAYPLIFAGIVLKVKESKINIIEKKKKAFLFTSLVIFLAALYFVFSITFETGLSFWEAFFNFVYNIGDAILIILVFFIILLAIQYKSGKLFWPWIIFIIALLAMFVGDVLFFLYPGEYESADNIFYMITELSFVLSYILFALSLFYIGFITENVRKDFLRKIKSVE